MGKAKPFLFGSLLGASVMFVAVQYHVVRSHDGFQLVPRTPQHSLGLAYADIRQWNASQWTDRAELARALMAHGSGDLISQSVAESLSDAVASESATLDQLKSFLNKAAPGDGSSDPGLFRLPDLMPSGSLDSPTGGSGNDDVFTIPFPRTTQKPEIPDPFRMAQSGGQPAAASPAVPALRSGNSPPSAGSGTAGVPGGAESPRSRFSVSDILDDSQTTFQETRRTGVGAGNLSAGSSNSPVAGKSESQKIADAVGDAIFGNESNVKGSAAVTAPNVSKPAPDPVPFADITADLESRARSALSRAQSTLSEQTGQKINQGAATAETYLRDRAREAVSPVTGIRTGAGTSPAAVLNSTGESAAALREKFDPFID